MDRGIEGWMDRKIEGRWVGGWMDKGRVDRWWERG